MYQRVQIKTNGIHYGAKMKISKRKSLVIYGKKFSRASMHNGSKLLIVLMTNSREDQQQKSQILYSPQKIQRVNFCLLYMQADVHTYTIKLAHQMFDESFVKSYQSLCSYSKVQRPWRISYSQNWLSPLYTKQSKESLSFSFMKRPP